MCAFIFGHSAGHGGHARAVTLYLMPARLCTQEVLYVWTHTHCRVDGTCSARWGHGLVALMTVTCGGTVIRSHGAPAACYV